MEPLMRGKLRSFFLLVVFTVFGVVVLLSALTIWGCAAFRSYLLPDPDAAYLSVKEVRADGTTSEMTTWLNFGEVTKLPQLTEEKVTMEEEPAGAPGSGQTQGGAAESGGQAKILQPDSGETDADWQGGQYTMREVGHGEVTDATYSIQKIEKSFDMLTPKRKLAYRFCGMAMVAVPAVLSICGILFAGFFFYRKRLEKPLAILLEATEQIAAQNLDFSIEYPCEDEMGLLCKSFERMREELEQNNKAMWRLLDQRRMMQASIAHDLRNPIAIIRGYTEYLQMHPGEGDLNPEKRKRISKNLGLAAKRLEQYTESVRALNRLEDMAADRKEIPVREFMEEVRDDFRIMADRSGIALHMGKVLTEGCLMADRTMLFRILENVFENATRFAASGILVDFVKEDGKLTITVADDGPGFPEEILKKSRKAFLPMGHGDGHLGMGLAISRVLCEKHGGSLKLGNRNPRGAEVKIFLTV